MVSEQIRMHAFFINGQTRVYGLIGKDSLEPATDYFLDIDFMPVTHCWRTLRCTNGRPFYAAVIGL